MQHRPATETKGTDMDLPLLVSPDSLSRLHDNLADASRQVGRIAGHAELLATDGDWQGAAHDAFASAARTAGAQCLVVSRRLAVDAARVEELETELLLRLAELYRLERDVLGALHRLATAVSDEVTGDARALLDGVGRHLPGRGSPHWHDVASTLLDGGWL
jgi:hypothetical protein